MLCLVNIAMWYYSFLGLELGSSFSPPLVENLLAPAFFFPSFKEIHYFFRHCRHMARQRVCVTRRFDFSTDFTVDLLKHFWDPRSGFGIRWNIELATFFECLYFQLAKLNFNLHFASLQAWISSPDLGIPRWYHLTPRWYHLTPRWYH